MTTVWVGAFLLVLGGLMASSGKPPGLLFLVAGLACVLTGLMLRSHKKTRDQMWEAELERRLDAQFGPEGQDD